MKAYVIIGTTSLFAALQNHEYSIVISSIYGIEYILL